MDRSGVGATVGNGVGSRVGSGVGATVGNGVFSCWLFRFWFLAVGAVFRPVPVPPDWSGSALALSVSETILVAGLDERHHHVAGLCSLNQSPFQGCVVVLESQWMSLGRESRIW